MNKIIACDLDDCVVDMMPLWIQYCQERFGIVKTPLISYNLCDYYGDKAMDFWSNESLYDDLTPVAGAKKTLDTLNDKGFEIGFVSYTKKGHYSSKCDFINKWFPYRKFILNTKEKNYTRCDWFIDDNPKNLCNQPWHVKTILYKTAVQHEQKGFDFVSESWEDIQTIVLSH